MDAVDQVDVYSFAFSESFTQRSDSAIILCGTFFADWRNKEKGICATVFQAHQNFPKALRADECGLEISLMPGDHQPLTILQGMSKTHSVFFIFILPWRSLAS